MLVSLYPTIWDVHEPQFVDLMTILADIKCGTYQDLVLPIRAEKDKKRRDKLKDKVPNFTVSGLFGHRKAEGMQMHSGLIAIDLDNLDDINTSFVSMCKDPHTFAAFRSISGNGLCVIFKIEGNKHRETFEALKDYMFEAYKLMMDPSCADVSRARYVSYDPDLYINEGARKFTFVQKQSERVRHERAEKSFYIHTNNKFEKLLSIIDKDITHDYGRWCRIGFAIAHEFGPSGLEYFQQISRFHGSYDPDTCAKQYEKCLKHANGSVRINSVYHYAKEEGFTVTVPNEERIAKRAYYARESGKSVEQIIDSTDSDEERQIIKAVFSNPNYEPKDHNKSKTLNIDDFDMWLRANYNIMRNVITRTYELDGSELESERLNSIYLHAKKRFEKLSRELFDTNVFSESTPKYNPIQQYFDSLQWDGKDHLEDLSASITSDTGTPQWRKVMVTKWLLGMVETVYTGEPNILLLILAGEKNTGKTQFFKRLLPDSLRRFFANSQLDKGKDDELLMTQKLIIFDDEYSGKSKQDSKHMKRMLSSDTFSLREPYGRKNVTLPRIATLCGTCNETEILNDATGNRRIIVIEATGQFNFGLYNSVNKDQLFAQLKQMHLDGVSAGLTKEEIADLEYFTGERYAEISLEGELVEHLFEPPGSGTQYDFKTTSVVKDHIETHTKQKISLRKLGLELRKMGYERLGRNGKYGYILVAKADRKPQGYNINMGSDAPF